MKRKLLSVISMLVLLMGLLPGAVFAAPLAAQAVTPVAGTALNVVQVTVNDTPGGQTDPHVSGDWNSYTDNSAYGIRFQNLDLGFPSDRLISHADGIYDSLSDINGNSIVFMRTASGNQHIYLTQIDPFGNPGPAVEISPVSSALRGHAAIGGDTIAYEDRTYSGSTAAQPEISLSNAADPSALAYRLTNDTLADQLPAISTDGNAVVWLKCVSSLTECDVWRAERTAGVWGAPEQVTGATGDASFPDTNGPVAVYGSNAGGDNNIRWSVRNSDGTYSESYLDLPGMQRNPNISGNIIAFESSPAVGAPYEIWLYDLRTNRLYQLTNTTISESLTDISTGPGGLVRVAWAQPKQVYPYDMDVYALSVVLDTTPPVITPETLGTLGTNGWYTSDVSLTWSVIDNNSDISNSNGCEAVSITSDQAATQYTCSADSDGGSSSANVTIARDATPPTVTITPSRSADSGLWYNHSVEFATDCADMTSGRDSWSGRFAPYVGPDTNSFTTISSCTDKAGNLSTTSLTIQYDSTPPVTMVTGVTEGATYDLGSVPQAGCSSTDNLSGVATEASLALTGGDVQGLGSLTATCSGALDAAGNTASPAVVHYTIVQPDKTYSFTGFFQPVENPGPGPSYVFNTVKAGSAIPVKFSLAGDQGLSIFAPDFPTSKPASCTTAALTDPIEETVTAGSSSLGYDALSDTYTYVWKTDKKWVGSCRMLNVTLDDGSQHLAYFQFK